MNKVETLRTADRQWIGVNDMTLDEAIIHCEEVAEEQDMKAGFETDNQTYIMSEMERKRCRECAAEHRQLAEWLKELREYKQQSISDVHIGKTNFKPGDKFILELGQERRMFGEFEIAGTDLYVKTDLLEKLRRFDLDYTGEWIFHQDWKDDEESPYECNWCGRTFDYDMNYCGYCGAYMKRKAK